MNGTLFGLALLTAAARVIIRFFHFQRKLRSDDFLLLFACLCLIASQILIYILKIDNIYWFAAAIFESSSLESRPAFLISAEEDTTTITTTEEFNLRISMFLRMQYSIGILSWTCIFAVKICFLLFFHQMIISLPKFIVAWRVIFGITIIFWAFSAFFINCSHFGKATCKCRILFFLPFLVDQNYCSLFWIKGT